MAATKDHDWQSLAQTLADGFQSLLSEADQLSTRQRTLDAKLKLAHQEVCSLVFDVFMAISQEEKF